MSIIKKAAIAALAGGMAAVTAAQTPGGPASRVSRGSGFGCQPPSVWVLERGGAICKDLTAPPPAPPVPPPSPVIPTSPPASPTFPTFVRLTAMEVGGAATDVILLSATSAWNVTVEVLATGNQCIVSVGSPCEMGQAFDSASWSWYTAGQIVSSNLYALTPGTTTHIASVSMAPSGDLTIQYYAANSEFNIVRSTGGVAYAWSSGTVAAAQWQGGATALSLSGPFQTN